MKLQKMLHNHLPQHLNFAMKFGPERCVNTATGPNQSDRARIKMTDAPNSGKVSAFQEIISRADAKARGLKRYYTGLPCKRGHIAERSVSSFGCLICKNQLQKEYSARNPGAVSAANKKHYRANHERMLARAAKYAKQNPEKNRANALKQYRKNPERYVAYSRNRKALKKAADGKHTAKEIAQLYKLQRGICVNCKKSLKSGYHADHIMPLIRGGSNWISNIQLLCPTCNLSKKALDPIEWAQREGRLI